MLSEMKSGNMKDHREKTYDIRGKAVLVLGGAAGAGLITISMLAEQGAPVFFAARDADELKRGQAVIAQACGEGEGLVADLSKPEEIYRLFDQAQYWLGRVDAVVSFLTMDGSTGTGNHPAGDQNLWMQEAILRMSSGSQGQIINVGSTRVKSQGQNTTRNGFIHNQTAMLRRQATEAGLRVTLIEPGSSSRTESLLEAEVLEDEDIARCVLNSLSQPYGMDVIFLKGRYQEQILQI